MSYRKDKKLDDTMDFPKIQDNVIDIKSKKPVNKKKKKANIKKPKPISQTKNAPNIKAKKTQSTPKDVKSSSKKSITNQKNKKNKSKSGIIFGRLFRLLIVILITISVIATLVTISIQAFFKVESIEVIYNEKKMEEISTTNQSENNTNSNDGNLYIKTKNNNKYTKQEVMDAFSIQIGDNLINQDKASVQKKLTEKLPYIETAEIKKKLPHTVILTIKETKVKWIFQHGSNYVVTNKDYKVLETITSLKGFEDYLLIKNAKITNVESGKRISLNNSKNEESSYYSSLINLLNAIENSEIKNINMADIKNINDVYLNYDNRIGIHIGEMDNIVEKLKLAKKTLETENKNNPSQKGELNLTIYKKAYFTPETKTIS